MLVEPALKLACHFLAVIETLSVFSLGLRPKGLSGRQSRLIDGDRVVPGRFDEIGFPGAHVLQQQPEKATCALNFLFRNLFLLSSRKPSIDAEQRHFASAAAPSARCWYTSNSRTRLRGAWSPRRYEGAGSDSVQEAAGGPSSEH